MSVYKYVLTQNNAYLFVMLQNSVMDELIAKIEMFASYIEMAAQAFVTPGFCLPVVKKLNPEKKQTSS